MGSNYPTASSQILACGIIAPSFSKSLALQESMQNQGRQLSNFFEFFIIRRPKAGMPISKRLFQFAAEYKTPTMI